MSEYEYSKIILSCLIVHSGSVLPHSSSLYRTDFFFFFFFLTGALNQISSKSSKTKSYCSEHCHCLFVEIVIGLGAGILCS